MRGSRKCVFFTGRFALKSLSQVVIAGQALVVSHLCLKHYSAILSGQQHEIQILLQALKNAIHSGLAFCKFTVIQIHLIQDRNRPRSYNCD